MESNDWRIARAVAHRYRGEQWWAHFDELVSVGLEAIVRHKPEGGNLTYTVCKNAVFSHFRHFGGRKETRPRPHVSYLTGDEPLAYDDEDLERIEVDLSTHETLCRVIRDAQLSWNQSMALAAYKRGDETWARDLAAVRGFTPDMARQHLNAARKKILSVAYTEKQ